MQIRFVKIRNDKTVYSQVDNQLIVQSCFDYCTQPVKDKVANFIEGKQKQLTLPFRDYKVRLEKKGN